MECYNCHSEESKLTDRIWKTLPNNQDFFLFENQSECELKLDCKNKQIRPIDLLWYDSNAIIEYVDDFEALKIGLERAWDYFRNLEKIDEANYKDYLHGEIVATIEMVEQSVIGSIAGGIFNLGGNCYPNTGKGNNLINSFTATDFSVEGNFLSVINGKPSSRSIYNKDSDKDKSLFAENNVTSLHLNQSWGGYLDNRSMDIESVTALTDKKIQIKQSRLKSPNKIWHRLNNQKPSNSTKITKVGELCGASDKTNEKKDEIPHDKTSGLQATTTSLQIPNNLPEDIPNSNNSTFEKTKIKQESPDAQNQSADFAKKPDLGPIQKKVKNHSMKNGDIYTGDMTNNMKNGHGICFFKDGEIFEGNWSNDEMYGKGKYTYNNGDKFYGEFKNNKKDGIGLYQFHIKDLNSNKCTNQQSSKVEICEEVYKGQWTNDTMNGFGIFYYFNGDIYKGKFKAGKPHHCGVYTFQDGTKFMGEYKYGLANGFGRQVSENGDIYEGMWVDDQKNGFGESQVAKGDYSYVGFWKDGERHGKGIQKYPGGLTLEGKFLKGKCESGSTLIYPNGRKKVIKTEKEVRDIVMQYNNYRY